jgi:hypothetical protein
MGPGRLRLRQGASLKTATRCHQLKNIRKHSTTSPWQIGQQRA